LIVSSAETVDGTEGGALTMMIGSGDRIPYASLGLSTISADGVLANSASLGISVGGLTAPHHNDLLALATNDFNARDWQVWLAPAIDTPESRPEPLAWKLDPELLPAYVMGNDAALSWVGTSGNVDGDDRDEVVWAMSIVDHEHCALVLIGAAPGSATLGVRSTIRLDEPCARGQLMLADADGDNRRHRALDGVARGHGAQAHLLATVAQGTGITFADVNADGAHDLVVAASGNLLLMKAGLRKP
jgi:hypothetical protein